MEKSLSKYLAFGSIALIVVVLMVATIVEKFYGTAFAYENIYTSAYMVVLWGMASLFALAYIIKRRLHKMPITLILHLSFMLILAGALTTHIWGVQGKVHLRVGEAVQSFTNTDDKVQELPFALILRNFELQYYEGTFAPMDYVSHIGIVDGEQRIEGKVSMNNILKHHNYRFYQAGYDRDGEGTTLAVSHDPWGIGITYAGYLMLLLSMLSFFFQPNSRFRTLLNHPALKRTTVVAVSLCCSFTAFGKENMPHTLPHEVAAKFGDLHIYYNERICPLQTFAKDFTTKLYGKSTYRGLTAEQVVTGWFFFYDDWKHEPMIKIKGGETQQLLGIHGKYARLTDFASVEGYKLEEALHGERITNRRNAESADEKFNLVSMLVMGNLLKIYPYSNSEGVVTWYSLADKLPAEVPYEQWLFIGQSMNIMGEKIMLKKYDEVVSLLDKIGTYQTKEAGDILPPSWRFEAEKRYNSANINRPLAMACVTLGIILFLIFCLSSSLRHGHNKCINTSLAVGLGVVLLYLTLQIVLRWIVSDHIPLSNGFETMQFMSWCSVLIALCTMRKFHMSLPLGYLLCGLSLLVSMMGEATPRITQLMPVLQSPLLSIHVVIIMIAYSLLAFTLMNGIAAIVLHYTKRNHQAEVEYLQVVSNIMLYPAVFMLATGIFAGAVWANISWGRYWGWDPKEVWALITLLVYSAALHTTSLGKFRNPIFFHTFMIIAFFTVLITYFGVNYLLGGMHSYA
ncbi:MAG: cytochrome c biogenesis protein CcsA [Bacteroidales bacterium]|nr:cytochrome c biogenesis protein CcsA [Bacteroidales bacterium]